MPEPKLPPGLDPERFVVVPLERLGSEALRSLLEEFVTRDGTDYGLQEASLSDKVHDVRRQLEIGEAVIVYDLEDERANVIRTKT